MRRVLCLLTILLATVTMQAQKSQDFASKFMDMAAGDTAVQCITVSPKMMEQLMKSPAENRNEHIVQAIGKLKSARIVKANQHSDDYYLKAETLLKRNAQRFDFEKSFQNGPKHGGFYTRKNRRGDTVELIMLHEDTRTGQLVIVNLTGTIDQEFISMLSL